MCDESQILKHLLPFICTKIGIANYDEYDLVREKSLADERDRRAQTPSNTLSRATLNRDKKKMEKLRAQLATDDDVHWVDQSKTLMQQSVDDNETLLLKRRYFYSDQNVDTQDPVQLNLLYVQCRDAIISGTHPVTQEQALKFAGLQVRRGLRRKRIIKDDEV